MAESSFPFIGGGAINADGWRGLHAGMWGDGATHDTDFSAFYPSVTGSDKVVTVDVGTAQIQGAAYLSDAPVNHNIGTAGSAPATGQYRWDLIVLRYDPGQPLADRVKQAIKPGTASTTPAFPALTQNPAGIWEIPLVSVKRGPGNVNITSAMVAKVAPQASPVVSVSADAALPLGLPGGGLAHATEGVYRRTSAGFESITDPTWTDLTPSAGITSFWKPLKWRREAGGIRLCGGFKKSNGAAFTANTWQPIAQIPAAWNSIIPVSAFFQSQDGLSPAFPVTLTSGMVELARQAPTLAHLGVTYNSGGGTVLLYPLGSAGYMGTVNVWLGQGTDPRLA